MLPRKLYAVWSASCYMEHEYQTFCHCERCEMDIVAISLNALPIKYVASKESRDAAFQQLNTPENIEQINKQIIRAIHVVGRNPRHDNEPSYREEGSFVVFS